MNIELRRIVIQTMIVVVEGSSVLVEYDDLRAAVGKLRDASLTGSGVIVKSYTLSNLLIDMGAAVATDDPLTLRPGLRLDEVSAALPELELHGKAEL